MLLALLLFVLLITGFACLLSGEKFHALPRIIAFIGFLLASAIMTIIGLEISNPLKGARWMMEFMVPWIPAWNINFHLGIDGLSFWLSALTLLMGMLSLKVARPFFKANSYYAAISWSVFGVVGLFLSVDIFLFFVFWEVALLPVYWMIILHGYEERSFTTLRFVLLTQVSGLFLLISVIGLAYASFLTTGVVTFDYQAFLHGMLPRNIQYFLLLGFLLAFLIKLPAFPFHIWMPWVFTQAPAPIVLVGILVKTAIFGLIRFTWPIFPLATADFSFAVMVIGIISALYGAVLAFSQNEPKRILAYGTLNHVGILLIGIFSSSEAASLGVFILLISQALSSGALLMILDRLYWSSSSVSLVTTGGLWERGPKFSVALFALLLASLGFPVFSNFIGEWLILWGVFNDFPAVAAVASISIVLSAVYALWLFQRLCFRQSSSHVMPTFTQDLSKGELSVYGLVIAILLCLGLYPSAILDDIKPSFSHEKQQPLSASYDQNQRVSAP